MSMRSWTEEGYGFPLFDGTPAQLSQVKKFLLDNRISKGEEDKVTYIMNAEDEDELSEVLDEPVSWVIAGLLNSMLKVNNIGGFTSCGDTGQQHMIGFEPMYSWNGVDGPKTEEEAKKIMQEAMNLLGVTGEPDYFTAEYFG